MSGGTGRQVITNGNSITSDLQPSCYLATIYFKVKLNQLLAITNIRECSLI